MRWYSPADGSEAPVDRVLSRDGATITPGVRELACRLASRAGERLSSSNLERMNRSMSDFGQAASWTFGGAIPRND